jgi:hypothetical protein
VHAPAARRRAKRQIGDWAASGGALAAPGGAHRAREIWKSAKNTTAFKFELGETCARRHSAGHAPGHSRHRHGGLSMVALALI